MGLSPGAAVVADVEELCALVGTATTVVAAGGRTHWEVGGPPPAGTEVRAPAGVLDYDPAELTVTVGAGTPVGQLDAVLAASGQQCPLDPASPAATVGGIVATGLSGHRRLRYGPLRNRVLEVRFVTADGRLVKGGGRTVKNVSGYDVPRLMVGSFGTLGVLTQVTLRCEPRFVAAEWLETPLGGDDAYQRAFRPACIAWDGFRTRVLVEGHRGDIAREAERIRAVGPARPPVRPRGPHEGRISVPPANVTSTGAALRDIRGLEWVAEAGVGTIHVAAADEPALATARRVAVEHEGWLLRLRGAPTLDGFGGPLPNLEVMARIKLALDPTEKLNPGRLPLARRGGPAAGDPPPPSTADVPR